MKSMKKVSTFSKKHVERAVAQEQIRALFAAAAAASSPSSANRLVQKARRLAMRHRIRLPSSLKKHFCSHCHAYLRPGVNCRVRLAKQRVIYLCLGCKKFMRFPYAR